MIRDAPDESARPKYAHVERERRWLIDRAALPPLSEPGVLIEDLYMTGTRLRLRRVSGTNGATVLKLTKKYEADDPLARPIVTAYLDAAEYDALATLPAFPLVKRRYPVTSGDVMYSVDIFEEALAGLVLAEIEWPDDAGLRALPSPPGALREVSGEQRYQGGALASSGRPKEQ